MRSSKKKSLIALFTCIVLVVTLISTSCSKKSKSGSNKDGIKIGLSIDTIIIERWKKDCDIFVETAKQNGAEVLVRNATNSEAEQIAQIEELMSLGVDVLVILPKNASSLTEVLAKAKAKGIPVISYDRLIRNADVSLYCSINSEKVGELMAESLLPDYNSGGYFCILGSEDDYNMILVDKGIRNTVNGSNVTIDIKYFTPEWNYDLAYSKMTAILNEGLVPQAVICGNDAVAECVIRALSEHKLDVPVVGQDADISACRRVLQGIQYATVYKPIYELASKVAEIACEMAKGKSLEEIGCASDYIDNGSKNVPVFWLDPILVTKENLQEVIIDSGFHSESELKR